MILPAIVIIIASILDAVFTLNHLKSGGVELNPIMAWAIARGPIVFWTLKMTITIGGVGVLMWMSKTSHWAHKGLMGLAIAYVCLIIYHLMIRN